jgi:hypothetical protein
MTALALATGCSHNAIKGDGMIKTEARSIPNFSKVVAAGAYRINWSSGQAGLRITTDQNLLPLITTDVSGDILRIEAKGNLAPTKGTTITLSSPSLRGVELAGAINFEAHQVSGQSLTLEATGASNITVDGTISELEVNLTGASKLKANSLRAQSATVSLVGASDAHVNATDTLNASITGAGSLTYSGNPKSVDKNVTGAGRIRHQP